LLSIDKLFINLQFKAKQNYSIWRN